MGTAGPGKAGGDNTQWDVPARLVNARIPMLHWFSRGLFSVFKCPCRASILNKWPDGSAAESAACGIQKYSWGKAFLKAPITAAKKPISAVTELQNEPLFYIDAARVS